MRKNTILSELFRRIPALLILIGMIFPTNPVLAQDEPPNPVDAVSFDQNLNAQLPLDAVFHDESGQNVRIGDYFGEKPVILVFAYFDCPMLCTLVLNDLTKNLKSLKFNVGDEFNVLTVSFDPRETPQLAAAKKETYLKAYDRPGASDGWHFLTANQDSIDKLTSVAGFHYAYDPRINQYAHPTGVIIVTPEGRISSYIFGIHYSDRDLRLGIVEASSRKIATPVDQFFLLCYHYDPVTGQYSLLINNVLRLAGLATILILGGLVFFLFRHERKIQAPIDIGNQVQPGETRFRV